MRNGAVEIGKLVPHQSNHHPHIAQNNVINALWMIITPRIDTEIVISIPLFVINTPDF